MDNDESKYFGCVDTNFSSAVNACAAGLKFKDPEQGLDQTLAELLLSRADKGETLSPDEMRKLAGLLSGHYIPYNCGTKKQIHTTEEQLEIVLKVEELQKDGKSYAEAIIAVEKDVCCAAKTIERYITEFNKLPNGTRSKLKLVDKS